MLMKTKCANGYKGSQSMNHHVSTLAFSYQNYPWVNTVCHKNKKYDIYETLILYYYAQQLINLELLIVLYVVSILLIQCKNISKFSMIDIFFFLKKKVSIGFYQQNQETVEVIFNTIEILC